MKLLFVEDEELDRIVFERMIDGLDLEVAYATGAGEAEQIIAKQRPDFVITDLAMPDCEGVKAVREFVEMGLPVVALTGIEPTEVACLSAAAGAIDILFKQNPPEHNRDRIKRAMKLVESRKQLAEAKSQKC